MIKIGDIKKTKYYESDVASAFFLFAFCFIWISKFGNIKEEDITISFFLLPIVVVITLIIHELIHIIFFKIFGKNKARIKVLRDKTLKAIMIYQENKDVFYTKFQTITILLMPLIIITIISSILLFFMPNSLIIKVNMILNILGNVIDIVITTRLLIHVPNNISINYTYEQKYGVILNYYK